MLNNLLCAEYDSGVYVLFLVLMILGLALVIAFLIYRIRKEQASFSEMHIDKGITSFDWLKKYIERMISVASRKTVFYLYQIDINDYEAVRKTLGDNQYAEFQKEICGRLNKLLPWGIKVAIKKDNCIVVYVKNMFNLDVEGLAKLIIESLSKDIEITNLYNIELSINVAVAGFPSSGDTADIIIKNLELAMVVSHRAGPNNYACYTPQMGSKETDEYKYYQEIQDAIKEKEFTLFYQPIIDTNTLAVYGSESLIRWKHRTMGVLPPSNFLYVMEQTGDINWVGFWCFEQMIRQHLVWKNNYPDNKLSVTINLSERQLLNPELADEMRKIARKLKANPADYIFEIASFGLFFHSEIAKTNINRLKEYGFKIALDNFGAEFNSPTTLEQLPIDIIKIESNFWRKSKTKGITADVFEMVREYCSDKNLMLVTQGVETVEEMLDLRQNNVNYMQGYLFSPPCEPRDFISGMVMLPWEDKIRLRVKEINDAKLAEKKAEKETKQQNGQ
ncbi:MAG: GGDEF domain-containing phosphodiesterase [Clostridia bacterium]|nr:GGDEF domain-containing phosphodiesterase [Clostridia bacterium]